MTKNNQIEKKEATWKQLDESGVCNRHEAKRSEQEEASVATLINDKHTSRDSQRKNGFCRRPMASLVAAILIRTHFREHYQPPFTGKECRPFYHRQHTIHALYVVIF